MWLASRNEVGNDLQLQYKKNQIFQTFKKFYYEQMGSLCLLQDKNWIQTR